MARVALGWGVRELSNYANLNKATISSFENERGGTINTMNKLQNALEQGDENGYVKFIENGVIYHTK